jgi:hypothetical protein
MIGPRHRRTWYLIAAIAIGLALVLLIVPQSHAGHSAAWVAILPIVFIGVIESLSLIALLINPSLDRLPAAPILPASFQRPPPFRLF